MAIEAIVKKLALGLGEIIKKQFWPTIKSLMISLVVDNIKELFDYFNLKIKKFINKLKEEKSDSLKYAEEKRKDAQERVKTFENTALRSKDSFIVDEEIRKMIEAETEVRVWKEVEDRLKADLKNLNDQASELLKNVKANEKKGISNARKSLKELQFDEVMSIDGEDIKLIGEPKVKVIEKKTEAEKAVKKSNKKLKETSK